jgi:hypothetical protein
MFDWRTLALAAAVFGATFAGGWWFGLGKTKWSFALPGAKASAPPPGADWREGTGLTQNELLRRSVVLRGKAYLRPYCYSDARTLYIVAATNYAEVLMRTAGCDSLLKCAMGESQLDRVWRANRSVLDRPVAQIMTEVHAAGGLTDRDFRGDVARAVRVIAGTDLRGGAGPQCVESRGRPSSAWRVRIRP